ncbi:MAG: DUF4380 domain-containing protein [Candidatus Coatesbacteria bacterium]
MLRLMVAVGGMLMATTGEARTGVPALDAERHLLVLRNDRVVVGISPRLAGRIVVFRAPDGVNVLDADPVWWAPEAKLPALAAAWDYPAINGHVIWTGPQKEWWIHQTISEEWRTHAYNWPPDPWGEWAPYEVAARTPASVTLTGPASPVTGLRLTKEVGLLPDGRVRIAVRAVNTRDREVSWDLWSNVRVRGTARSWVPVTGSLKIEHGAAADGSLAALDYEVRDGWFRFLDEAPIPAGAVARTAKAFLTPSAGLIAAFDAGRVFLRRFTPAARAAVHPDQGVVEVFRRADRDPAKSLCELEVHGAFTSLPPGGTMALEETWELRRYPGSAEPAAQAAWLKALPPSP